MPEFAVWAPEPKLVRLDVDGQLYEMTAGDDGWGDTILPLPDGVWTDRLTGARFTGPTPAGLMFGELPVVLLERSDA